MPRADLPAGTVTFLFTDIEGSTRLLQELGERYAEVLAEHRRLLREAFAAHEGVEVDTQGDAFFYAFARASEALAAAEEGRRALEATPVRVRMGVHTGEPVVTDEGYVGMDVHKGARIAAAGHGGQVLVSEQAARLAGVDGLVDLGAHQLKDLTAPERIWQLGKGEHPPLKTLHRTNLPDTANALVGRTRELAALVDLLREHRLVSVTGPGGTGKTRLAVQAAAEAADYFPDGVFWVPLQSLEDPALVLSAAASALGAEGDLEEHVSDRRMLLVLDNLEQLLPAAAAPVANLCSACPSLVVLVTSRAPLRVSAELELRLEPLPLADAVALFRQRAIDSEPQEAVAEICRRLDGLPLALELAAARTRLLPPAKLLARLASALPLLTGGARDAPERQRTLAATIAWSYDLLSEEERRLFCRLGVFSGGFELEAAEEVVEADPDVLESLIDCSLVRRWGPGRFGLLETIREFALAQLGGDDHSHVAGRHAEYFLALAEGAEEEHRSPDQAAAVARLRLDDANLRAALAWLAERGDVERELRLAAALGEFWLASGQLVEGRAALEGALARAGTVVSAAGVQAFEHAAFMALVQGEVERGRSHAERGLALARELDDGIGAARLLGRLAMAAEIDDRERAVALYEDAIAAAREQQDPFLVAMLLNNLAGTLVDEGEAARAAGLYEEAAALNRKTGGARRTAIVLANLAITRVRLHDLPHARDAFVEALELFSSIGDPAGLSQCLQVAAEFAQRARAPEAAARLLGACEALYEHGGLGGLRQLEGDRDYRLLIEALQADLGRPNLEAALVKGRELDLDHAVAFARRQADAAVSAGAAAEDPTLREDRGGES